MKKTLWAGIVVLALIVAGYVALPFYAMEQLQRAAQMAGAQEPEKGVKVSILWNAMWIFRYYVTI